MAALGTDRIEVFSTGPNRTGYGEENPASRTGSRSDKEFPKF